MPQFLTAQELYRTIQRELPPDDVYPDGVASGFFSTADSYATAQVIADYYAVQAITYQESFPLTAIARLSDFEIMYFGYNLPSTLTVDQRRELVLQKIRNLPAPTAWNLLLTTLSIVPQGTYVQFAAYNPVASGGAAASWQLGVSELGINTALGLGYTYNNLNVFGQNWCSIVSNNGWQLGVSELGVDDFLGIYPYLQLMDVQLEAYAYEMRIFGYTLTALQRKQLDALLSEDEAARDVHIIKDGLSLSAFGLVNYVTNVDAYSMVNCIKVDPTSNTGYSGVTT